mmetsp:Transcript_57564/g.184808  ORF Transcript_57564/g.184808 Transcript_57564/m.184808 type:complete len:593 (-) Transcript_57564:28-1806(-)
MAEAASLSSARGTSLGGLELPTCDCSGQQPVDVQRTLRGQIRCTFLVALAMKRWAEVAAHARAAGPPALQPRPPLQPPLCHSVAALKAARTVGFGPGTQGGPPCEPVRARRLTRVATPSRGRAATPTRSCALTPTRGCGQTPAPRAWSPARSCSAASPRPARPDGRAAARLLHLVLRAPVARQCSCALSLWRARAVRHSGELAVRAERLRGRLDLQRLEALHSTAARAEAQECVEAKALARLQGGLRKLESERRQRAEAQRGAERLLQCVVRAFTGRQAASLALGLGALAAHVGHTELERLHKMLASEAAERQALAAEVRQLTEADAKVSAELARAAGAAQQRARRWALAAVAADLRNATCRGMHAALNAMHSAMLAHRFARACPMLLRLDEASPGAMGTGPLGSVQPGICQMPGNSAACSGIVMQGHDAIPKCVVSMPRGTTPASHGVGQAAPEAMHLEQRADALMRLKVQLGLRHDFAARVCRAPCLSSFSLPTHQSWGDVATAANGDTSDVAAVVAGAVPEMYELLSARLARGSACLLEYILASALRARLRTGLNAILAVGQDRDYRRRRSRCSSALALGTETSCSCGL